MAERVLANGRGSPCQWSHAFCLCCWARHARHSIMASNADLSSLLTASKNLTSHLSRPDLPSVQLSLDQIEAQSRHLVSRLPHGDTDRAYVPFRPCLDTHSLTFFEKAIICLRKRASTPLLCQAPLLTSILQLLLLLFSLCMTLTSRAIFAMLTNRTSYLP